MQARLCEEGIKLDPTDQALNGQLYRVRLKRQEEKLIGFYEPILRRNPTNAVIAGYLLQLYIRCRQCLFELGERLSRIGESEEAIACYARAYAAQPTPRKLDPLYALAFLYTGLGRTDEAIGTWERIIHALDADYRIRSGETVDWARREIEKLRH